MRVALGSVEVSDDYRRALACRYGEHNRLATRDEVRQHLLVTGSSVDDDMFHEHGQCDQCRDQLGEEASRGDD